VRAVRDGLDALGLPDTGKDEKGAPRPPEVAVEGGQVRIGDEKLIGNAFVMMGLAGKTVVLLCEPKDVECWANLAMNGGIRKTPLKTRFSRQRHCGFQP